MTGANTVSILSWISVTVNLILIALIVFLVVSWIRKTDSRTDESESRQRRKN